MDELCGTVFIFIMIVMVVWGHLSNAKRKAQRDEWNRKYGATDFENPYN